MKADPMLNEQELAGFYEAIKDSARRILDSGEEVVPYIFVLVPGQREIAAIKSPMADSQLTHEEAREVTQDLYGILAQTVPSFCTVTEVWTAKTDKEKYQAQTEGDEPFIPPSERPDRQEALLVALFVKGRQQAVAMLPFERKGKTVTTPKDWLETGMSDGHFAIGGEGVFAHLACDEDPTKP